MKIVAIVGLSLLFKGTRKESATMVEVPLELFEAVTRALGSSRFEPELAAAAAASVTAEKSFRGTAGLLQRVRIHCPSLSLDHEHQQESECASLKRNRNTTEKYATSLLSRPLSIVAAGADDDNTLLIIQGDSSGKEESAATRLLDNMYKSFAVLVESRIHAYVTLIARHLLSKKPKDVSERLDRLLTVGAAIYAERRELAFELEPGSKHDAPLRLRVSFDLVMPRPTGEKQVMAISVQTLGSIHRGKCYFALSIG